MISKSYQELEWRIEALTKNAQCKFFFTYFDLVIRLYLADRVSYAIDVLDKATLKDSSFIKTQAKSAIELVSWLVTPKKPTVQADIQRFNDLHCILSKRYGGRFHEIHFRMFNVQKQKLLLPAKYKNFVSGMRSALLNDTLLDFLKDKLDEVIEIDHYFSKKIKELKKSAAQYKSIVTDNSYTPINALFYQFVVGTQTKTITIQHGYIQDPQLITVLPTRTNLLAVWTESERNFITDNTNQDQSGSRTKIIVLGCPNYLRQPNKKQQVEIKTALLLVDDFLLDKQPEMLQLYKRTSMTLSSKGFRILLRPHPKARSERHLSIINSFGEVDYHTNLKDQLNICHVVVGRSSSVLFEAQFHGVAAYQLTDERDARIAGTTCFSKFDHRATSKSPKEFNLSQLNDILCWKLD